MSNNEYKNCPYCDEEIKTIAVKCRYCQTMLNGSNSQVPLNDQEKVSAPRYGSATIEDNKTSNKNKLITGIAVGIIFIAIASLIIFNLIDDKGISGIEEATINFDGGTYTGQVVNGVAEGYGSWEHPSGDRYEGEFKNNKFHGQGTITLVDGSIYEGQWKDDLMHGYGTVIWPDGTVLEGRFEYGEYLGYFAMEEESKDEIIDNTIFVDVPEYENLNLRSGPGTDYPVLGKLRRGTELNILNEVIGSDGDQWFQVITPDGKEGWVHSEYVTLKKPS